MATVLSVNRATRLEPHDAKPSPTGIAKTAVTGPVDVAVPGPARSGLAGDLIGDTASHGGPDQALYAVAREVLDHWAGELGRDVPDGMFGENLTTTGLDVDAAELGERWRIGDTVVVQVTSPRVPCVTFRERMGVPGWLRRFTADARPGAYLRVIEPGPLRAGDPVEVVHRPGHGVTVTGCFRAVMGDRDALPGLLAAGDDLLPELRDVVARRGSYA